LWATHRLLPPVAGGEFAGMLDRCLAAGRKLSDALQTGDEFTVLNEPMLDIVVFSANGVSAQTLSHTNKRLFDRAARRNLHLALIELPVSFVQNRLSMNAGDEPSMSCLRSVLMKPEHADWVPDIVATLDELVAEA
jgi:glutamate/tyrosine decarboxylase-like PLP-dependent enzyme